MKSDLEHRAMMNAPASTATAALCGRPSDPNTRIQRFSYFVFTVLGFSFWFFMAVPFASHRETYWWLAMVHSHDLGQAFAWGISSTYRPLAQAATWLGFQILDPRIFPTSVLRQTLFQLFIYLTFIFAWWLICSGAVQRRLLALFAFVAGLVFFSGYVHLFHIYGLFYVPVMLEVGALLRFHASQTFRKREAWLAGLAILLVFWHPFTTAIFAGFYFGFYLDTLRQRSRAQHIQAAVILLASMIAIIALVVLFPRTAMPLDSRLFGFDVTYRTNEVNLVASLVASLLTLITVLSTRLSPKITLLATLLVFALGGLFVLKNLPLLLLWLFAVLVKLVCLRCWSLFFLTLTAALLPFGGAIGTPIYALFAIIVAVYATALGWLEAEEFLSFLKPGYVIGAAIASLVVLLLVRAGINVPVVTRVAMPLLAERERTYQMENILAWLRHSDYCSYDIGFVDNADNPIKSVESALTRRYRPPAVLDDVRLFWKTVLRCGQSDQSNGKEGIAMVTFGGQPLPELTPVFEVKGKYAGRARIWIGSSPKRQELLSTP